MYPCGQYVFKEFHVYYNLNSLKYKNQKNPPSKGSKAQKVLIVSKVFFMSVNITVKIRHYPPARCLARK